MTGSVVKPFDTADTRPLYEIQNGYYEREAVYWILKCYSNIYKFQLNIIKNTYKCGTATQLTQCLSE